MKTIYHSFVNGLINFQPLYRKIIDAMIYELLHPLMLYLTATIHNLYNDEHEGKK